MSAYNGWRHERVTRGGHIPGAIALPAAWLKAPDGAGIMGLLAAKGITPDREVVVCGADSADGRLVARRLAQLGIRGARFVDGGAAAWAADATLPIERLSRYERLVPASWLSSALAGERMETAPAGRLVVLHVTGNWPEDYDDGHIPGAVHLATSRLEDPHDWNRRSPGELEAALLGLGITARTTVVAYGRDVEENSSGGAYRPGQLAAARALLILAYAGVEDIRLLDGGLGSWAGSGLPLERKRRQPAPASEFGATIPARPQVIIDIDEAKAILADRAGSALVSVRSRPEQTGTASGYGYIGPAGRIAGDVWGNAGSDANHMEHYRNPDSTMRAHPEIAARWAGAGITPDRRVAFYCGTGWRASEAWLCAYLQGWPRVAVYDGGWFEWSKDPVNNPIATGEPTVDVLERGA